MKECKYPNCRDCEYDECIMEAKDIHALLKRRRWHSNPEYFRQKQQTYRRKIFESIPHCNECKDCICIKNAKGDGLQRICVSDMRLIERKIANSPYWCWKRKRGEENGKEHHAIQSGRREED